MVKKVKKAKKLSLKKAASKLSPVSVKKLACIPPRARALLQQLVKAVAEMMFMAYMGATYSNTAENKGVSSFLLFFFYVVK